MTNFIEYLSGEVFWLPYIFFSEGPGHIFCAFFCWIVLLLLLSFENSISMFGPLSDKQSTNIFSKAVACLFILLSVSFKVCFLFV